MYPAHASALYQGHPAGLPQHHPGWQFVGALPFGAVMAGFHVSPACFFSGLFLRWSIRFRAYLSRALRADFFMVMSEWKSRTSVRGMQPQPLAVLVHFQWL